MAENEIVGNTEEDYRDEERSSAEYRERHSARNGRKKKKKKRKWVKWVVIAVIAAAAFLIYRRLRVTRSTATVYQQDVATRRDISTSYSYTGTIAAVDSQSVMSSVSGAKVTELDVELGDTVQKGDVICKLDTSDVEEQIAEKQASMDASATSSALQIQSAQQSYNQLQSNINDGLDSSLQQAQSQIDSAFAQLVSAQQAYNEEVSLNNQQLSSTILQAMQSMDNAYEQVESAELRTQQAKDAAEHAKETAQKQYQSNLDSASSAVSNAQKAVDEAQAAYDAALAASGGDTAGTDGSATGEENSGDASSGNTDNGNSTELAQLASQLESAKQALEQAQESYNSIVKAGDGYDSFSYDQTNASNELSEEQAKASYEQAKTNYEAAKINEENNLTRLYDSLIQAQNSYLSAIDSYNATVRSNNQRLESYALQIQQAEASADDTLNQLQMGQLKDSLDDYVVTAPISGKITSLDIKVDDIISATTMSNLATITNYDTMKVSISVSEYEISNLQLGDTVTVSVDALDKDFDGTVTSIDAVGSSSSGIAYFNAEVQFTPDDDVMVGMTAEVKQTITKAENVVSVLSDAIMTGSDGSSYVLVENNGNIGSTDSSSNNNSTNYLQWPVTLGATDGTYTEIQSGLTEGETVYYAVQSASTGSSTDAFSGFGFDSGDMQGGGGPSGGGDMPGGNGGGGTPPSGGGPSGGGAGGGSQ